MRPLNLHTKVRLNGAPERESGGAYREVNPATSTY